jgi:hypothetical protein
MEEFKSILLALGAAFAIALGALLLALLIKKPAEAFQEELKLPPEILKKIYPAWRYWAPLVIGFLFVLVDQFRLGPGTSTDTFWPLTSAWIIGGVISSVYFLRQWLKEPAETALRKLLGRNLAASFVQIVLCAVLLWMHFLTRR